MSNTSTGEKPDCENLCVNPEHLNKFKIPSASVNSIFCRVGGIQSTVQNLSNSTQFLQIAGLLNFKKMHFGIVIDLSFVFMPRLFLVAVT